MQPRTKTFVRIATLSVGLACGAAIGAIATSPIVAQTASAKPIVVAAPAGAPMSFADLIDKVSPAVVSVSVITEVPVAERSQLFERFRGLPGFEDYFRRQNPDGDDGDDGEDGPETDREGRALGSGFFISAAGHVVTNNHVVENAREVVVTLDNGDELEAEVIGKDEQTDLAVLKVKKPGSYPYVEFGTRSKPRVGDWVVAVGNPFGLGGTATAGIVSADGREIGGPYTDFIQVDAAINRGNSGGPTFNLNGQVIGVNTAIFSTTGGSVGIGFAIEANAAKSVVDTLIRDGKVTRGWLGVSIQSISPQVADALDLPDAKGAIVADVTKGSPASKSGFKSGDIIVGINGDAVKDSRDVTRRVGGLLAGSNNTFKIIRDGKPTSISVTVAERPAVIDNPNAPASGSRPSEPSPEGSSYLGATTRPLSADEVKALDLEAGAVGLMITKVDRGTALAEAGIRAGDALLRANNRTLKTSKDFEDEVKAAKAKGEKNVVVSVRRGGQTSFLPIDISK
ncbi:Do family serine endopeptidase [bacterium]|nr:Do family serine endopeptidase [bacterium]